MRGLLGRIRGLWWAWREPRVHPAMQRDITDLQDRIASGELRLAASAVSLALAWFPPFAAPNEDDRLLADMGVASSPKEIQDEYAEEVRLFRDAVTTPDEDVPLAPWQQLSGDSEGARVGRKLHASLNKAAFAMENWDRYAIPVRLRGSHVFRIWSPADVMGEPLARSMPADRFVAAAAVQSARDRFEILQLRSQRNTWAVIALLAVAGFLWL